MTAEAKAMRTATRRAAWALSAPAALLLAPRAALAAPVGAPPAHVIEVAADEAHHQRAQLVTQALRERVVESREYFLVGDNRPLTPTANDARCDTRAFAETLRADSDRGLDRRCQARMAKRMGAKTLLWGHLYERADGRLMAKVHLYDEAGGERVAEGAYDDRGRRRLADRLYRHLVEPGAVGEVRLTAEGPLEGSVYVNGQEAGAYDPSNAEYTASAGDVAVEVRAGATVLARGRGAVVAGGAVGVWLERVAAPPAPVTVAPPTLGATTVVAEPSSGGTWRRAAGWAGVGAGVALLGAGVYASGRVASRDDELGEPAYRAYREGFAEGDACTNASRGLESPRAESAKAAQVRDVCSSASLVRTLQYVFYGAGALSAGAGAYVLLSAPGSASAPPSRAAAAGWRVLPAAAGAPAGVSVRLAF